MCHEIELVLECSPMAVPVGRHAVGHALGDWGLAADDEVAWRAALIVSELVANGARFCSGELGLRLEAHRHRLEITVTDDSPLPPVMGSPSSNDFSGRGLRLVATLSEGWGYRFEGVRTKQVWASLAVPSDSPLGYGCRL